MKPSDFANQSNAEYVDSLFQQYLKDPNSVDDRWRTFFAGFETGMSRVAPRTAGQEPSSLSMGIFDLVHSFRELGHFEANLDPLGSSRPSHPLLDLTEFGMTEEDLKKQVGNGGFLGKTDGSLGDLIAKLRQTYCGTLGVEYIGISDKTQRDWLQEKMEPTLNRPALSPDEAKSLLFQLVAAEEFERFLATRNPGAKRFGLEGAEVTVPLINFLIEDGVPMGAENYCLGMAHRGRLNVLAHVMNKPYEVIMSEFKGTNYNPELTGDGDVKYHLGYSNVRPLKDGSEVKLSLSPNPSHLELVNPVIEGIVRCKQTYLNDKDKVRVVPILIHGDAAFTGQGVVHETLCLSELPGYRTGGTIHIIINNQVGFTTDPIQGRFTPYPTDVAKNIQAPIFHVNGDDPEAVIHAGRLAIAFRERFKCDVMVDVWCYRRNGHNEVDEPEYTQPLMYRAIKSLATTREIYAKRLLERGVVTQAELDDMKKVVFERLEKAEADAKEVRPRTHVPSFGGVWKGFTRAGADWSADTKLPAEMLRTIADKATQVPAGFTVHPKLVKMLKGRHDSVNTGKGIDWGTGEMLGMGSLLLEGFPIRFTGQDVERGTFTHRHAVLHDYQTGATCIPLNNLSEKQAQLTIMNSMLSELAVLGFEYGYSSADPRNLVIWEAQFGDFVNGAQPIIDQFITAAESKWQQSNGLVMMLPHGYEGQGPEHSNAYLERFLSLCAEDNIQVVVPSNPAQVYHALRRQMLRKFRKPLVLFQPKSMLRFEPSFSKLEEFTDGSLQLVIDDPTALEKSRVRRVLLCAGKVYYSLIQARDKTKHNSEVAVIRIEQPYPFPRKELAAVLAKYKNAEDYGWVQEEPANRGAYSFIDRRLREMLARGMDLKYFGRDDASSPAVGSHKVHQIEEQEFLGQALDLPPRHPEIKDAAKAVPASANSATAVSD
jgi:2-oxoglutarate dehydrogenase E1 component